MTTRTAPNSPAAPPGLDSDGALVITRVFDAPREAVFEAWTRAEHFARWFGPHGTTLPVCEVDARPGGALRFLHRHANGEDVWVRGVYLEVVAPERLVIATAFTDPDGNDAERPGFGRESRITVTFAEEGGGTRLTMRQTGLVADQGEGEGWMETMDRLAEFLAGD